jgi:hypothetical protein
MEDVDLDPVLPMQMQPVELASKVPFLLVLPLQRQNKLLPLKDNKELQRRLLLPHHVKVMMDVSQVVVDSILVDVLEPLLHSKEMEDVDLDPVLPTPTLLDD